MTSNKPQKSMDSSSTTTTTSIPGVKRVSKATPTRSRQSPPKTMKIETSTKKTPGSARRTMKSTQKIRSVRSPHSIPNEKHLEWVGDLNSYELRKDKHYSDIREALAILIARMKTGKFGPSDQAVWDHLAANSVIKNRELEAYQAAKAPAQGNESAEEPEAATGIMEVPTIDLGSVKPVVLSDFTIIEPHILDKTGTRGFDTQMRRFVVRRMCPWLCQEIDCPTSFE